MAQNAKPAAQKPEDPTVPKKNKKSLFIIIGAVVAVALAGGGGWYFAKGKDSGHHDEEVKVIPPKPPIFLQLDPFTVNLQSEGSDQYLQMGISMKYFEPELEAKIKLNLPEIRSKILQLLTTKTASELLSPEGKSKLVKEIITMSNTILGIVEPAHPAAANAAHAAASEVSAATTETHAAPASGTPAETTPAPAPKKPAEKKGIADALFTSFIIQ